MTGPQELRDAFVAGSYWGMDNPFGLDTDIPQAEALLRYPDAPQASEAKWKCTKCGCRVENPWDGGHLVEMCHPTWCGPVERMEKL
jgi:hypothetical protein